MWLPCRIDRNQSGGWNVAKSTGSRKSAASFSFSRRSARSLFSTSDRDSPAVTATPVGSCVSRTVFDVLFRFCPPGPDPRYWSQRHWARRASSESRRVDILVKSSHRWGTEEHRLEQNPAQQIAPAGQEEDECRDAETRRRE